MPFLLHQNSGMVHHSTSGKDGIFLALRARRSTFAFVQRRQTASAQ